MNFVKWPSRDRAGFIFHDEIHRVGTKSLWHRHCAWMHALQASYENKLENVELRTIPWSRVWNEWNAKIRSLKVGPQIKGFSAKVLNHVIIGNHKIQDIKLNKAFICANVLNHVIIGNVSCDVNDFDQTCMIWNAVTVHKLDLSSYNHFHGWHTWQQVVQSLFLRTYPGSKQIYLAPVILLCTHTEDTAPAAWLSAVLHSRGTASVRNSWTRHLSISNYKMGICISSKQTYCPPLIRRFCIAPSLTWKYGGNVSGWCTLMLFVCRYFCLIIYSCLYNALVSRSQALL